MANENNITVVTFTPEEKRQDDVLKYIEPNPKLPLPQFMIANKCAELARFFIDTLPRCPQRTHALNDCLDMKDAAVRASLSL
jgi:hypothetical protein